MMALKKIAKEPKAQTIHESTDPSENVLSEIQLNNNCQRVRFENLPNEEVSPSKKGKCKKIKPHKRLTIVPKLAL